MFFTVVWTKKDRVYLIELATKKYKNGIRFTKKIRATKHPLVILEKNVYRKSEYFVFPANIVPNEVWLPIEVKYGSKLYKEACKRTPYPICGTAFAKPVNIGDFCNKYIVTDPPKDEKMDA